MSGKAIQVSGVLLAALGLALGVTWAQQSQPAPAKAPVVVTYYYLPG